MKRKLIETPPYLPLDAISVASKRDKDKKTGTIKNVHKWFAPMPTPALRALIFGAVVDAPDDSTEHSRLLQLVERLVPDDGNPPDEHTLEEAREAIRKSTGGELPTIFDPFCGGGSTLIEAQRLGLPAEGSDLNPVPVLITRTLTQLIPAVAGRAPIVGDPGQLGSIAGGHLDGLLADVKHYAQLVREDVLAKVGDRYPAGPNGATVIAWLWAWTAKCLNPACGAEIPLVKQMRLSKRRDKPAALVADVTDGNVWFKIGKTPSPAEGLVSRSSAHCLVCDTKTKLDLIRDRAANFGLGLASLCAVADSGGDELFLEPESIEHRSALEPKDGGVAQVDLPDQALGFRVQAYGMQTQADLYLPRQLATLEAFADAIARVPESVQADGGDDAYATAIASILGLALGKLAQSNSSQVRWLTRDVRSKAQPAFGRHALPMIWDFAETNPFGGTVGDWLMQVKALSRGLARLPQGISGSQVFAADARHSRPSGRPAVVVTDPPYFDQIGYADLSDYFYIWHRRALRDVHPDLYGTIATPKSAELIATPYRHDGDKRAAAKFFVDGFTDTFESLRQLASPDYPLLIVYAHRQEENSSLGDASTGWDAMLEAVLAAGLTIEGTLPIRGTSSYRQIGLGTNSLANYIVMVCRPSSSPGRPGTIADFRTALRAKLPTAVEELLGTGESMVDIRQAAIGPGMEVFCQFSKVFDGSDPIPVRTALSVINDELGRILDEHLGSVDEKTRWACNWYVDHGFQSGEYDEARQAAQTLGVGVDGIEASGIVESSHGEVRLLPRTELPVGWMGDDDTPLWKATQHLVKRLTEGTDASEDHAAELLAVLGPDASGSRDLAQYLTNLSIEKGWSEDAIAYDALVKSWPRLEQLAVSAAARPTMLPVAE